MDNNKDKVEYLKTVLITLACIFTIVCIVVRDISQNTHERVAKSFKATLAIDAEHKELERLYEQEKQTPSDFMINLKIALILEHFKEFEQAKINYEKALVKAPNNAFVMYRLALFYISQKQHDKAVELIERLSDKVQDSKIVNMKMTFYETLSDSLADSGDYDAAVRTARLASRYAKAVSGEKYSQAEKNLANKYSLLADYFVREKDDEQAIIALKNSMRIYETSAAKYKLALIYRKNHPEFAYRLMEEVFNSKDLNILNLEIYYNLISKLYGEAVTSKDETAISFYSHKRNMLKKFVSKNYIFKNDLSTSSPVIVKKKDGIWQRYKPYLEFSVSNDTKTDINLLYIKAEFTPLNSETKSYEKRIAVGQASLPAMAKSRDIIFKLDESILAKNTPKEAKISIFARKNKNFNWTLLYENFIKF